MELLSRAYSPLDRTERYTGPVTLDAVTPPYCRAAFHSPPRRHSALTTGPRWAVHRVATPARSQSVAQRESESGRERKRETYRSYSEINRGNSFEQLKEQVDIMQLELDQGTGSFTCRSERAHSPVMVAPPLTVCGSVAIFQASAEVGSEGSARGSEGSGRPSQRHHGRVPAHPRPQPIIRQL